MSGKKIVLYPDHPKPVTRRDFLRSGLLGFSATFLAPSVIGQILMANRARAQCVDVSTASSALVPFLVVDMAGGAALPGNFLVGKQGGPEDLLSSYDQLGWDPKAPGALDKSFGLPMSAQASKILAGMKQTASAAALANFRWGSFCAFSRDDTSDNALSALTLVSKAGFRGKYFDNGLGAANSASGGNSAPALNDLSLKPLFVERVEDVTSSLSYGDAFQDFSDDELRRMGKAIHDMSSDQASRLGRMGLADQLKAVAECGYKQNMGVGRTSPGLDPRVNSIFQQVYGINPGSQSTDPSVISAAITMNVLNGNAGPGCLVIGGCDYHTSEQATGDGKDQEAGIQIGRFIESAFQLQRPAMIQLITDGGVSANPGTRNWSSDASVKSLMLLGYFDPKSPPAQRKLQVGNYVDGQAVNQATLVGAEPTKAPYAVLANYLNVAGKLGDFPSVAPSSIFTSQELDEVLIFG